MRDACPESKCSIKSAVGSERCEDRKTPPFTIDSVKSEKKKKKLIARIITYRYAHGRNRDTAFLQQLAAVRAWVLHAGGVSVYRNGTAVTVSLAVFPREQRKLGSDIGGPAGYVP